MNKVDAPFFAPFAKGGYGDAGTHRKEEPGDKSHHHEVGLRLNHSNRDVLRPCVIRVWRREREFGKTGGETGDIRDVPGSPRGVRPVQRAWHSNSYCFLYTRVSLTC